MFHSLLLWLVLLLVGTTWCQSDSKNDSMEDFLKLLEEYQLSRPVTEQIAAIRSEIFRNYDKMVKPSHWRRGPLDVGVFVNLMSLHKMSYRDHSLHVQVRLAIIWRDVFLSWSDDRFHVHAIRVDKDEVFRPDITSYEAMSSSNTFQRDTSHRDIVLFRSGTLVWYPLVWVHTRCKVNLADWPFDLFNCSLRFGSWIYTSKNIQLQTLSNDIGSHGYTENSKWKLIGNYCISGDDLLENETYSFVTCWIQVQHQPGPHQYLIYWPIAFALLLQLSSLFLETRLWTRFHLNTLAFIALLLETLFLSYYLSDSSFETPRILKFLSQMLVLSFSTLFWSSVALNLSQSSTIQLPVRVLSVIKPIESWFSPEVDLELEEYAKSYQNSEMRTLIKLIDILWFCMSLCIIIGLWLYYF